MNLRAYKSYPRYLMRLIRSTAKQFRLALAPDLKAIDAALDGQASAELRRLVPLGARRRFGAFFTGSELASKALRSLHGSVDEHSVIYDAACGAGDLLIAAAIHLPVETSLRETLKRWDQQIYGRDLHREFVSAAKARLTLAAMLRSSDFDIGAADRPDPFPNIKVGCGLSDAGISKATHIVINPPFIMVEAPSGCGWGSGKINSAAMFVLSCLKEAKDGARLIAILPDVLRSGSRYRRWRYRVEELSTVRMVTLHGQFDQLADVDVFSLSSIRNLNPNPIKSMWQDGVLSATTLGDYAHVRVGPLVSYRDPQTGPWFPFVQSRNLPSWKKYDPRSSHRRFQGRTFKPPFVVVRRTSRPGDKSRAVATIITGPRRVAVENHLLVVVPRDNTIRGCEAILRVLKQDATNGWLDARIRCRHLTVSSLIELPWLESNDE